MNIGHGGQEARLRAALAVLGIEVPDRLHQAHSEDASLRVAALWALLWRSAAAGMGRATAAHIDHGLMVGPWMWPLTEDQPLRAVDELRFAADRVAVITEAVSPWSVPVRTGFEGDADVDGWAAPAGYAIEAAICLLGPLANRTTSPDCTVRAARHWLNQAHQYLERLAAALDHGAASPS